MKRFIAALALASGLLAMAEAASAQNTLRESEEHSHIGIDVHGTFEYWGYGLGGYGLGGGARVEIPLLRRGFTTRFDNSFGLSIGADLLYRGGYCFGGGCYSWWALVGHADVQWNVYFTPKLSAFVEAGFAPEFWFGCGNYNCQVFNAWFDFAVGGRYHFRERNGNPALILRLGNTAITFGVEF